VVLSQSGAILDYLSRELGRFGPANEDERRGNPALAVVGQSQADQLCGDLPVHEPFQKKADDPVTQFLHARAMSALEGAGRASQGRRDFVVAGRPTIADLSLCGYLFWPDQIGMDL
jgi:glutathione S-transferase